MKQVKINLRVGENQRSTLALLFVVGGFVAFWYLTVYQTPVTNLPTPSPEKNVRIVAIGDSLISGNGSLQHQGFIQILNTVRSEDEQIMVIENPNGTAQGMWNNITKVTALEPRLVIISIGMEDALTPATPIEQVERYLERSIGSVHESGGAVLLLENVSYEGLSRKLKNKHQTALASRAISGIYGKNEYMFNAHYINDAGHELLAERVGRLLERILSR